MKIGSTEYATLAAWIASGAGAGRFRSHGHENRRHAVASGSRVPHARQQLRVEAIYSDGLHRDVTALAKFDSMDEGVLSVTPQGLVTTNGQGQASALGAVRGTSGDLDVRAALLEQMRSLPAGPIRISSTSWRRPSSASWGSSRRGSAAMRPFCGGHSSTRSAKSRRSKRPAASSPQRIPRNGSTWSIGCWGSPAIPKLDTYNDAYAAWWTLKWSDLIRNQSNDLGEQGMWAFHNWLSESFRSNKPFDRFVRELVTAKGSIYTVGPANFFRINTNPADCAEATAQLFLGVRLQCARCHHHPFEKYGQDDYYSFAAYFARVGAKSSQEFGLFGRESVVIVRRSGEVVNPRTGSRAQAQAARWPAGR